MTTVEMLVAIGALILLDVVAWFWSVDSRRSGSNRPDRPAPAI